LSEKELAELFQRRAEALAASVSEDEEERGVEVFRFSVGAARFAIEMDYVRTITSPTWLTRIPGAPAHLSHVAHVGGRIVSLFRVERLLDIGEVGKAPDKYLLVGAQGLRLGIGATDFEGIDRIDLNDLNAAGQRSCGEFVRGVANDMTMVLDGARLVSDLRVEVGGAGER
jgi:chemotaxis signal transduction protein